MKHKALAIIIMSLAAAWIPAHATDDDSDKSFGTRYSFQADKKIAKGWHIYGGEEIRLNGFSSIDRLYTSIGTDYKINDYLKVGAGYDAISAWRENSLGNMAWDWRHRLSADITGSYKVDQWRFSLKEKFQATYKTRDINEYQQPQTAMALRSRFKVSYKIPHHGLEPYVSVEHRLALNEAKWDSNSTTDSYKSSVYEGHSDIYTSRVRAQLGIEWKLNKRNSLEFYGLCDAITDKDIDSKKSSATLKQPITTLNSTFGAVGISYTFSF